MPSTGIRQKKTVSVTLEPMLLQQARDAGLNLSSLLADAVQKEIRLLETETWQRENRLGIQALNRITDEQGLFSDDYRTF